MKEPTYDLRADPRFPRLLGIAAAQPHPLMFATVSGAHLYGFPSPDSDYDLRGVHLLPAERVVGLDDGPFTIEVAEDQPDIELDLVTHDVKKFFDLMLRRNGYVLEQLWSPLVVHTTAAHDELKAIAAGCVTRHHCHHYRGRRHEIRVNCRLQGEKAADPGGEHGISAGGLRPFAGEGPPPDRDQLAAGGSAARNDRRAAAARAQVAGGHGHHPLAPTPLRSPAHLLALGRAGDRGPGAPGCAA